MRGLLLETNSDCAVVYAVGEQWFACVYRDKHSPLALDDGPEAAHPETSEQSAKKWALAQLNKLSLTNPPERATQSLDWQWVVFEDTPLPPRVWKAS